MNNITSLYKQRLLINEQLETLFSMKCFTHLQAMQIIVAIDILKQILVENCKEIMKL